MSHPLFCLSNMLSATIDPPSVCEEALHVLLFPRQNIIPVFFLILALLVVQTLPGVNDSPPEVHFTLDVSSRCSIK